MARLAGLVLRWVGRGVLAGAAGAALTAAWAPALSFDSEESRRADGRPVRNEVRFVAGLSRDVWLMTQTHGPHDIDRLAIVVDKSVAPKRARFYQLEPGADLEDLAAGRAPQAPYRASCFTCHVNGPRALRPELASESWGSALRATWIAALWNLRVKTYGRVLSEAGEGAAGSGAPFRRAGAVSNEPAGLLGCARCHHDGKLGRGTLLEQHASTVAFMVRQGYMPPRGFGLSPEERDKLNDFMNGIP
ncbi:MAG TPA: cytochrome c [Bdellovibrionales bacterium]|nr:cytochrome c [Bdellovibrionales bacterium]